MALAIRNTEDGKELSFLRLFSTHAFLPTAEYRCKGHGTFNAPSTTQQKSGIGHDCEVLVHDHFLSDVEHMLKVPHAVIYGSGRPFKRTM